MLMCLFVCLVVYMCAYVHERPSWRCSLHIVYQRRVQRKARTCVDIKKVVELMQACISLVVRSLALEEVEKDKSCKGY